MVDLLSYLLRADEHLLGFFQEHGIWVYLLLFLIVFAETGFVVTPFLPGDSLLFAAGALAGSAGLNIWLLFALLSLAAILGDSVNYWAGHRLGPKAFKSRKLRGFLREEYVGRTREFYAVHGGKTIILARFVPIVRTFAPFMAGVGGMEYGRFFKYNVFGGLFWVGAFLFSGFLFGNIPAVKENFSILVLGIILVSLLPLALEAFRKRKKK